MRSESSLSSILLLLSFYFSFISYTNINFVSPVFLSFFSYRKNVQAISTSPAHWLFLLRRVTRSAGPTLAFPSPLCRSSRRHPDRCSRPRESRVITTRHTRHLRSSALRSSHHPVTVSSQHNQRGVNFPLPHQPSRFRAVCRLCYRTTRQVQRQSVPTQSPQLQPTSTLFTRQLQRATWHCQSFLLD